jgi:hypothetical protein|tara:strand:+ start:1994 stop:2155 length:162 start_codon:yes stop_codon:yes gene_type:complete
MNEIINKFCPTTIFLNVGAISLSLSEVEIGLKILSYAVAITYTAIKIFKELKK